ncbi:MAG: hypothetical protein IPO90_12935 [Flavobacteriales bacterium]|nr:hypothetical protein [Flavobacteriales bacterium]
MALAIICCGVVLLFLLKNLFRYFAVNAICVFRNRTSTSRVRPHLRQDVELPLRYHSGERKATCVSAHHQRHGRMEYSVMYSIEMVFREPISVIFIGAMVAMSAKLTSISGFKGFADQRV